MNEELTETEIKKQIIEYSANTLNMEKDREQSLYAVSNTIITCISILLVAIMSLTFELLDRLKNLETIIIIFGSTLTITLLISLLFAIKSHWFYKKEYTKTGLEFLKYINENNQIYNNVHGFLDQKITDNDQIISSLEHNNNLRLKSLTISSIFIYIFLGLIPIFGIIITLKAI